MAYTDYLDTVQSIYIAYYQRPADPAGLRYWAQRLNAEGGNLDAIIDAFSNSPEAKSLYTETDPLKLVDSVYQALFGRPADNGADNFYVKALEAGKFPDGRPATLGRVAIDVLNGAQGDDRVAIDNKLKVANDFTQIVDGRPLTDPEFGFDGLAVTYKGDADAAAAREFLKGVTSDPSTVPTQDGVKEVVAEKIADPTDAPVETGKTFMLTANQDTLTGTSGNDTFVAGSAQDGAGNLINTLQTVDSVNGGDGTDTLNVTLTDATKTSASDTITPTLTSIENIAVRFADTANGDTLDLSLSTGVQSVTVQNSANTGTVQGLGAVANLTVQNQNKDVNFDNSTAATLNLTATNVGTTAQIVIDLGASAASKAKTVNLALNGADIEVDDSNGGDVIETLNVTATGKNNVKLSNGDNSITAVTVTGAGSVDLSDGGAVTLNALKTLTATDNQGGVTVVANTTPTSIATGKGNDSITVGALAANASISTGDGNDSITVGALAAGKTFTLDGGAGNDTFDLTGATAAAIVNLTGGDGDDTVKLGTNLSKLDAKSTINGGAGTNTIGIADGADLTAATVKLLSNFQVLDITGGKGTYDVSLLSGANTISIAGADFAGNVTLNNVLASTVTNVSSAKSTDLSITKTLTFTPKDASAANDVLTLNLQAIDGNNDGTAQGNITLADIKLTDDTAVKGIETVKIVSSATPDADDPATSGVDETLKATAYTNTITKLEGTANTTTLDVTANAGLTINTLDASLTGLSTIKVAGAGDFTITNALDKATLLTSVNASGSTGAVTIDASANTKSISYIGSDGVDTFTAGTAGSVIYTGKGADVVTLDGNAGAVGAVRDTIVLKAATDSFLTDTNKDGKITLSDSGFDVINNFDIVGDTAVGPLTTDLIDVTNFAFSGAARGVVDVSTKVTGTTDLTSIAGLFNDPAGNRGVAFATVGTDGYVFVDANHDGNFSAANDLVIQLAGVTTFTAANVAF